MRTARNVGLSANISLLVAIMLWAAPTAVQAQAYNVLYSFSRGIDGGWPEGFPAIDAAGNIYGTTSIGGDLSCDIPFGCGTVFKFAPTGRETVLHSFRRRDGRDPFAGVILDEDGNLYGTTSVGGRFGYGTVFEINSKRKEATMFNFTGGADGGHPFGGLVRDADGNLYGTAGGGEQTVCSISGCGVVFKVDASGNETVLHSFLGPPDGDHPAAGLVRDKAGNLYGTAESGGDAKCLGGYGLGCGIVFELDPQGHETVLHRFRGAPDDGFLPVASLVLTSAGDLYGTTIYGGNSNKGVVFKLSHAGEITILHNFTGGTDGGKPMTGLIRGPAGNFYGTTFEGGSTSCGYGMGVGCGVIFRITKLGRFAVVHTFTGGADGGSPSWGGLGRDRAGNIFGMTSIGGTSNSGVLYEIVP